MWCFRSVGRGFDICCLRTLRCADFVGHHTTVTKKGCYPKRMGREFATLWPIPPIVLHPCWFAQNKGATNSIFQIERNNVFDFLFYFLFYYFKKIDNWLLRSICSPPNWLLLIAMTEGLNAILCLAHLFLSISISSSSCLECIFKYYKLWRKKEAQTHQLRF